MKILAVVESKHLGNTLKVAKAMAEAAPVTVTDVKNAAEYDFDDYDIVGFGSGIYYGQYDKELMKFVEKADDKKAYAFVLSTSGAGGFGEKQDPLIALLKKKNKIVLGSFRCRGHDKFILFRLIGGLNKGHPDENDLKNAKDFIRGVIEKYNAENK